MLLHDAFILIVAALASARIAVLVSSDLILDKPRTWFYRHFPPMDNPVLGYDYQRHDKDGEALDPIVDRRKWYLFSELLTCTRCLTVWTTLPLFIAADHSRIGLLASEVVASMAVASWAAKKL